MVSVEGEINTDEESVTISSAVSKDEGISSDSTSVESSVSTDTISHPHYSSGQLESDVGNSEEEDDDSDDSKVKSRLNSFDVFFISISFY